MTSPELALLDVGLGAAGPFELVLHQVRVVRGGDEVVVEGLRHVLVQEAVGRVEDGAVFLVQVHEEPVFSHVLLLLRWTGQKK